MASKSTFTFLAGNKRFTLDHADLQRFPDSLLHSLCTDVQTVKPINIDVSSSQGSPFASWETAVPLTVGLYRHGVFPVATLSQLLAVHTALDLYSRLTALSDYLGLPSPLTKLLPDKTAIPLMYAGVHELHTHALVTPAANCMLMSAAFSDAGAAYASSLAMFYVAHKTGDPALHVYAVKPADARALMVCDVISASAWRLDSMGKAGSQMQTLGELHTPDLVDPPCGTPISQQRHSLGAPFAAALSQQLKNVPVGGRTGVMKVECVNVEVLRRGAPSQVPVWVVRW